jgi:hypothetical protein
VECFRLWGPRLWPGEQILRESQTLFWSPQQVLAICVGQRPPQDLGSRACVYPTEGKTEPELQPR